MIEEKRMELWTGIYMESPDYDEPDRTKRADAALASFDKQFAAKTEDSVEDPRLSVGRIVGINGKTYIAYQYNECNGYAAVDVDTGRALLVGEDSNIHRLCVEAYGREE